MRQIDDEREWAARQTKERKAWYAPARTSYVATFACPSAHPESIIVEAASREEALQVRDGLACPATEARPLAEVRLRGEPWMKDGFLRCEVAE